MKKLKLLKDQYRIGKKGDAFTVRTAAQAAILKESGIAEDDTSEAVEKTATDTTEAGTMTTANTIAGDAEVSNVEVADAQTGKKGNKKK